MPSIGLHDTIPLHLGASWDLGGGEMGGQNISVTGMICLGVISCSCWYVGGLGEYGVARRCGDVGIVCRARGGGDMGMTSNFL
jgi:hypothetical protein